MASLTPNSFLLADNKNLISQQGDSKEYDSRISFL